MKIINRKRLWGGLGKVGRGLISAELTEFMKVCADHAPTLRLIVSRKSDSFPLTGPFVMFIHSIHLVDQIEGSRCPN